MSETETPKLYTLNECINSRETQNKEIGNRKTATLLQRIEQNPYRITDYLTPRVKAVLNGKSKRKTGFTQDEVATLFLFDKGAQSSTGNFYTEVMGFLTHYRTIASIKTLKGTIIINRDDWSGGFARVTHPPISDYSLNLSLIQNVCTRSDLLTIEILDHKDESQRNRPATLLKLRTSRHFI